MAKQTRSQRKARRRQQAEAAAAPQRARARQTRPEAEQISAEAEPRRVAGGGLRRFVEESVGELKKVEWPGQRQVMTGTVVVLIACAIVGGYLWGADLILKRVVQNVILGQ
jgi:preprotein translocase subunit SecE